MKALGPLLLLTVVSCAHVPPPPSGPLVPFADYHQHLIGPGAATLQSEAPAATIQLPADLQRLLDERARRWNDATALADVFTEDAAVLDPFGPAWIRGGTTVAKYLAGIHDAPYHVRPVAFGIDGPSGYLIGYLTEGEKYFAHVQLSVRKAADGNWRIAAESPLYEGPFTRKTITGEQVVAQLDDAGMQKAVVLSVAYWFASARRETPVENELEKVRAENDYVAAEVAKFPNRLVGFCSFNPLRDYALEELERCAKNPHFKGVKLHFGNSGVDMRKPEHAAKLREVFAAANAHRLAILAHLWTSPAFEQEGRAHAEPFLNVLLPAAPDVAVVIAHMAGGGRSTDTALGVFADAIAAGDPRTKNLYFDVATLTAGQSDAGLRKDVERMRQIGFDRILYGTDSVPPNPPARRSWGTFRAFMPLTEEELRSIADHVAPFLR